MDMSFISNFGNYVTANRAAWDSGNCVLTFSGRRWAPSDICLKLCRL